MNEAISSGNAPKTDAEYKAAIDAIIAELEQADVRIKRSQQETERLRAETRAILAEFKAK